LTVICCFRPFSAQAFRGTLTDIESNVRTRELNQKVRQRIVVKAYGGSEVHSGRIESSWNIPEFEVMAPRSCDTIECPILDFAGIFTCAAITYQPWYALIAYFIFVAFVVVRLIGARRLEGVMPTILTKYDTRISELEAQLESRPLSDQTPKYGAGEAGS
jgi:hypothetical protein